MIGDSSQPRQKKLPSRGNCRWEFNLPGAAPHTYSARSQKTGAEDYMVCTGRYNKLAPGDLAMMFREQLHSMTKYLTNLLPEEVMFREISSARLDCHILHGS